MEISLFFPLLLLVSLVCDSLETCPPPEDISPCWCRASDIQGEISIDCIDVSVKEIDNVFDNLRGKTIDIVYIENVKGDSLPSLLFWNTRVRRIDIYHCNLRRLSDSDSRPAFLGLENSLQSLSVSSSIKGNNQLKTLDLSHLKNLENLCLYDNNIAEVRNDWFANGPLSLKVVRIIYNGVSKLGNTAFAPLANLQELLLFQNRLTSIDRSMFPNPALHLAVLELQNNNFTSLSNDIFSGMPSLHTVYLQDNSIRRIEKSTWSSIWEKLIYLNLEDNPLECDSHMEWMFSQQGPRKLLGSCNSPESVKGMRLWYFLKINRKLL